jgi:hypothetical protein
MSSIEKLYGSLEIVKAEYLVALQNGEDKAILMGYCAEAERIENMLKGWELK